MDQNIVEIRWLALDRISAPDWPRLEEMLDKAERERAGRFHFEHDRGAYIAAHALLRAGLSRHAPAVPPGDWQFALTGHGRPEITGPCGVPPLRFNISHTHGMVAVALTFMHDIGLDVESLDRNALTLDLARRYFSPAEVAYLASLPKEMRHDALYGFWTLKEAYVKAIGRGLSLPLDSFTLVLDPPHIRFASGHSPDDPDCWLFRRFHPLPSHMLALALRHPRPNQLVVDCRPELAPAVWTAMGRS